MQEKRSGAGGFDHEGLLQIMDGNADDCTEQRNTSPTPQSPPIASRRIPAPYHVGKMLKQHVLAETSHRDAVETAKMEYERAREFLKRAEMVLCSKRMELQAKIRLHVGEYILRHPAEAFGKTTGGKTAVPSSSATPAMTLGHSDDDIRSVCSQEPQTSRALAPSEQECSEPIKPRSLIHRYC
ncbi:MAG: hypothetical protein Q9209_007845 [Squamulea sp. 1 TL-2023]